MNKFKFSLYALLAALLVPFSACEDEDLNPVLTPETAVHGLGEFAAGSATSFFFRDMNTGLNMRLQWISIDQLNTVTKIDLFIQYREGYIDVEGNPRIANHGTVKFKTIEGGAVPGNRTYTDFSASPSEVYELFKNATFDYGDGNGSVSVFSRAGRTATARFTPDDSFTLTWAFTTADGRYFDSWSDSVCSEFPGANCDLQWAVVCESDIAGEYDAVAVGTSTDVCCPTETTVNSVITLTQTGDGKYEISDWSGGLYLEWYDVYGITPTTNLKREVLDVCGRFVLPQFTEPFGEPCSGSGVINEDGTIVFTWENGYGDKATITMTPK